VQILTFLLVTVVLAEIRGFKLVMGFCLLAWIKADPSPDQQHCAGFIVVYNKLENDFIGEIRA